MSHFGHDRGLFHEGILGISIFRFCNIILGIHEYDVPSYNATGREFIEDQKIQLE